MPIQQKQRAGRVIIKKKGVQQSQHVNKTNSKAEVRFNVNEAYWISDKVKQNLRKKYPNLINKEGEIVVTNQTSRVQNQNLQESIHKLREIILDCSQPDKKEFVIPPPSLNMQKQRVEEKRKKSIIKLTRQNKSDW